MEVREAESTFAEGGFAGGQRQRLSPAVAIEELIVTSDTATPSAS